MIRIITAPINCALHRAINVLDRLTRSRPVSPDARNTVMTSVADALDAITRDADRTLVAGALHQEITALANRLRNAARGM